jgi:hypothetical protein
MNPMRPHSAKIIQHAEGLGTPNSETVRQRAREIAMIDGRSEFNEEDWRAAKRELHGGHELSDTNGDHEMTAAISEHDMVVGSLGHHTPNMMPEDNENVLEELIAEGNDEAIHEQMLAARREQSNEEISDRDDEA